MTVRATPVHPLALISARIDGEISAGETKFLEGHLESCALCREKEAELRSVAAGLRGLRVPEPPTGALDRLLARLREAPLRSATPSVATQPEAVAARVASEPSPSLRAPWRSALAGAAVVAVAILAWFVTPRPDRPTAPDRGVVLARHATVPQTPDPPGAPSVAEDPPQPPLQPPPQPPPTLRVAHERPRSAGGTRPRSAPVPTENVAPAPPAPPPEPPPAEASELALQEPQREWLNPPPIPFKGDAKRLSREARERVEGLAELLRDHPEVNLAIRGCTDERRSSEKTLSLGRKRAERIASYLMELGIDEWRLRVESVPIDGPEEGDLGGRKRAREDRVEFVIEPRPVELGRGE